jgi:hypothetical protein
MQRPVGLRNVLVAMTPWQIDGKKLRRDNAPMNGSIDDSKKRSIAASVHGPVDRNDCLSAITRAPLKPILTWEQLRRISRKL